MTEAVAIRLLPLLIKSKGSIDISVKGHSMQPTLYEGDIITIAKCDDYNVGDILVFGYKDDTLITHRLIKKTEYYLCKGDNAFRIEDITFSQIIGKVVRINSTEVIGWEHWKIDLSYQVNRLFHACRYDVSKTREMALYKLYEFFVLERSPNDLRFWKNENGIIDFVESDFDNKVLNCITQECSFDMIIENIKSLGYGSDDNIDDKTKAFLVKAYLNDTISIG